MADLGVTFQDSSKVTLPTDNCTAGVTVCNQLASDLEAKAAELRDDAKDYRFYPVARSAHRRFVQVLNLQFLNVFHMFWPFGASLIWITVLVGSAKGD